MSETADASGLVGLDAHQVWPVTEEGVPNGTAEALAMDLERMRLARLEPNLIVFAATFDCTDPAAIAVSAPPGIPVAVLILWAAGDGFDAELHEPGTAIRVSIRLDVCDTRGFGALIDTFERMVRVRAIQPVGIVRRPAPTYRIDDAARDAGRILARAGRPGDVERVVDTLIAAARPGTSLGPPRLLVDTSTTAHRDAGTGIQRVVKKTLSTLYDLHAALPMDRVPQAVRLGRLDDLVVSHLGRPDIGRRAETLLGTRAGDILLLLDSSWGAPERFDPAIAATQSAGGMVIGVVYDLAPYLHPDLCDAAMPAVFDRWLRWLLRSADGIVCISHAVADELVTRIVSHALPHRDGLRIGWWHLGSDIAPKGTVAAPDPMVRTALEDSGAPFAMIGTIEPRKRHAVVLEAFENLWSEGSEARLVLMGKAGWNVGALVEKLRDHPEQGRRLHWFPNASDADVAAAYAQARALVFASVYEGYGLPVVEAARAGLPVIAADIPVLREVGGEGAAYFAVDDPIDLSRVIRGTMAGGALPDSKSVNALTWQQSVEDLLDVILGDNWHVILRER